MRILISNDDGVYHTEDRCVHPQPQRERQHGDRGEARRLAQPPNGESPHLALVYFRSGQAGKCYRRYRFYMWRTGKLYPKHNGGKTLDGDESKHPKGRSDVLR